MFFNIWRYSLLEIVHFSPICKTIFQTFSGHFITSSSKVPVCTFTSVPHDRDIIIIIISSTFSA